TYYASPGFYKEQLCLGGTCVTRTVLVPADDVYSREITGDYNVKAYGAVGNGSTDDATAIQAAIDACQTQVTSLSEAGTIFFPPGRYVVDSTITWKSCHLVGSMPNNSVRIFWGGSAGGTMFTKDAALPGGTSFGLMEGLNLRGDLGGGNEPATFIDLTAGSVDKFLQLSRVHFQSSSGDAIKVATWVNLHWTDLRWDNIGGYAIRLTPVLGQNLSTFSLDRFTYDHSRASGPANGFILVDNTVNSSNLGTFAIKNGRIEVNTAWTGDQAIFTVKKPNAGPNSRTVGLSLIGMTYQDNIAMASDVLAFQDTSGATTSCESLIILNSRFQGLSAVLGGDQDATSQVDLPTGAQFGEVIFCTGAPQYGLVQSTWRRALNNEYAIRVRVGADVDNRFAIRADGQHQWGDGTAAFDIGLFRSAANTLQLASGDKLHLQDELELDGDLNHDGTNVGFFGVAPAPRPSATDEIKSALALLGLLVDGSASPLNLDAGLLTAGGVVATTGAVEYADAPTLAASTTPSVTGGNLFLTANTASITDFTGEQNGQIIILLCEADTTTSLVDSTPLFLNGTFTCTADDTITLISNGTVWYEISRSTN
ncbi:hypothetical protein LCGC14_1279180, partial [marine sediment metagenome]